MNTTLICMIFMIYADKSSPIIKISIICVPSPPKKYPKNENIPENQFHTRIFAGNYSY